MAAVDHAPCRLSVIVLTYGNASTLPRCIASIRSQLATVRGELIVVDNDSPDETLEVARTLGIEPLRTGANLGFAKGCNLGARAASGDVLVFVNPDAVLDEGCLEALVNALEEGDDVGVVGGRAHAENLSYDPRCVLGSPSVRGSLLFAVGLDTALRHHPVWDPEHGPADLPPSDGIVTVAAVSGALLTVSRALWTRLGGFDERFFLYGEDVDLCLRAAVLGHRTVVATAAGYQHVGGVSSSPGERDVLLHQAKAELYRRHLSPMRAAAAVVALQAGALTRGLAAFLPSSRLGRRARRWWHVFRSRHRWRAGYSEPVARSAVP